MIHGCSLNEPCKPESGKSQLQSATVRMNFSYKICTTQADELRQKVDKWWYKAEEGKRGMVGAVKE